MNSLKKQIRLTKIMMLLAFLLAVWVAIHLPAIWYGTENLPLHMSYIGDEQSPVNGALHVLQDKNLLAFRNLKTVYYGPLFPIISLPAVVLDFGEKFISGRIQNSNQYKNYILWNWGGIAWKNRVIATIFSFAVIILVFMLCNTRTLNQAGAKDTYFYLRSVGNKFLFLNTQVFRHWVFVLFSLVGLIYCLVRLYESHENKYQIYCVIFLYLGLV